MPSLRRRASVLDAEHSPEPAEGITSPAPADALSLAEEAEAEAAEAEAVAAAARARARAIRLRREAAAAAGATPRNGVATAPAPQPDLEPEAEVDVAGATATDVPDTAAERAESPDPTEKPITPRRTATVLTRVAAGVVVVVICAAVAASIYMVMHHRHAQAERQRAADFAAAARQGVVTLMSLNFKTAKDDVQRIIDNSTGDFKNDFEGTAGDFTKVAEQSKVITEATVNATGVKSMTDNSAEVIVAATSRITNAAGAKQDPRTWRLIVDVVRDGDRIKMSKVEFAP